MICSNQPLNLVDQQHKNYLHNLDFIKLWLILFYMGNYDCCENNGVSEEDLATRCVHKGLEIDSLPELSDQINQFLNTKQPYKQELSLEDTRQSKKIKIGNDVYQGSFNSIGQPSGFAKCYKEDGSLYVGKYQNGQMTGYFYYVLPNGSHYYGHTKNGFIEKGIFLEQGFTYEGSFYHNLFHGQGIEVTEDYQFEGIYTYGKRSKGKLSWKSNNFTYIYEGEFDKHGNFSGYDHNYDRVGVLTEAEGIYEGEFFDGLKHGQGLYKFSHSGLIYEGQYCQGRKQGKGKLMNSDNTTSYEGEFLNGLPHGNGLGFKQHLQIKTEFQEGIPKTSYQKLMNFQSVEGNKD